ncbi:POTRA domain-containing protein [Morganella morganii]
MTDAITGDYLQRGFITSRAFLTEQDLSAGILSVAVTEGTQEAITLEG